jgi:hypothetical protein
MATPAQTLNEAVGSVLKVLQDEFLPSGTLGLPDPSVTAVSALEKAAGIGGHVGNQSIVGFAAIDLKAVRTEIVAQFQLWGSTPIIVDQAIGDLNNKILADRGHLWSLGFLKLAMESAGPTEHFPNVGWRKQASYRILYESVYEDANVDSIITRIPINIDGAAKESTVVTDGMVRWDNETAPGLVVRGPFSIGAISALAFVPDPALSGSVIVIRTFDGATGAPAAYLTLQTLLDDIVGTAPKTKHASVTFASPQDFVAALSPNGSVILGDWDVGETPDDNIPDKYLACSQAIPQPLLLKTAEDRFEIHYQSPPLNKRAVLYLRLEHNAAF